MNESKNLTAIAAIIILLLIGIVTVASAQYDGSYEWAPFALGGLCFAWVIIWFVIFMLIAIWVYKDAEKRGKSGVLWLIIVILLGLIGIIIWLILRPPIGGVPKQVSSDRRCPNCGRVIPEDAKLCPYCSKKFEEL